MKTISLTLVLWAVAGTTFGEGSALKSAGITASYDMLSESYKATYGSLAEVNDNFTYKSASFGGFLDFGYLELGASYRSQIGVATEETTSDPDGYPGNGTLTAETKYVAVNGHLFVKLPNSFGGVTLFPLAGMEYSQNIDAKNKSKMPSTFVNELNDVFLDFGAGADLNLTSVVFLRASIIYGLNLTCDYSVIRDYWTSNDFDYKPAGYQLEALVGVGFRL